MRKAPGTSSSSTSAVTVLSVGPVDEDYAFLRTTFDRSEWTLCPDSELKLDISSTLQGAIGILGENPVPVVLCESDLRPGTWKELLEYLDRLPDPPFLIVTSRHADERLWAEALNLGAYDVLLKPFDCVEVIRAVSLAWLHWKERREVTARSAQMVA